MDNRSLIYNHNPMKKINPEESNDIELEMLVNVASRLHSNYLMAVFYHNGKYTMATNDAIASEALALITACKKALKEGER